MPLSQRRTYNIMTNIIPTKTKRKYTRRTPAGLRLATQKNDAAKQEPKEESRHDKFLRLGQARINRALVTMRLIGNLAGTNYEYNEQDVTAIKQALQAGVEATLSKFQMNKKPPAASFTFRRDVGLV